MLNGLAIKKDPASIRDAAIQKNIFGSSMTVLIISNKKIKDVMKIVKSSEESDLLTLVMQLKMKQENKKVDFLECY